MADITIYGIPVSTYVRTARMACEEKGVSYEVEPVEFGSPELLAVQPFNHIPAMRHGDFVLHETSAICRYLDEAFDGPALQPSDVTARARMNQWISALNHYVDRAMIRELVIERLVAPSRGRESNEAVVSEAVPKIEHQLGVLGRTLSDSDYLAGKDLSLADLFLLPMVFYLRLTPEGERLLDGRKAVNAWFERMAARPSFEATLPPMTRQAAE